MTTTGQDGAAIRLLDVYAEQIKIGVQLAVVIEQQKMLPDHEARLRVLEGSRSRLVGASFAVSTIVSGAATWIGLALTHH